MCFSVRCSAVRLDSNYYETCHRSALVSQLAPNIIITIVIVIIVIIIILTIIFTNVDNNDQCSVLQVAAFMLV